MSAIIPETANNTNLSTNNLSPNNSSVVKPKEYAKVIYKYEASNSDELSLPEDALILVLNKQCEDEGWYEGEYNGKRGLFPENFVKLIVEPTSTDNNKLTVTPPILPAKPNKPMTGVPIATMRDIQSNGNNLSS